MIAGCPVCSSSEVELFFQLPRVPVHCNLLWPDRQAALQAPRGEIQLAICPDCGHVFNQCFDPSLMRYTQQYENALDFSPRFQRYLAELASDLVTRHHLYGKDILEIGCGQGEFLHLLCTIGQNRGVGFDPAAPSNPASPGESLRFVQDLYSEKYSDYLVDFLCSRQTLEHIDRPRQFMERLHETLRRNNDSAAGRAGIVVFFEVPNAMFILDRLSIWDIIYEHPSYFTRSSLVRLFSQSSFEGISVRETYEGQFLCIEGRTAGSTVTTHTQEKAEQSLFGKASEFAASFQQKLATWHRQLEAIHQAGKTAALWGAGSKGVTFLNIAGSGEEVSWVVDINPRKHGMYVAGTGQEIMSPDRLPACQPGAIIIMNSIYEGEIRRQVEVLGLSPEFIIA